MAYVTKTGLVSCTCENQMHFDGEREIERETERGGHHLPHAPGEVKPSKE